CNESHQGITSTRVEDSRWGISSGIRSSKLGKDWGNITVTIINSHIIATAFQIIVSEVELQNMSKFCIHVVPALDVIRIIVGILGGRNDAFCPKIIVFRTSSKSI